MFDVYGGFRDGANGATYVPLVPSRAVDSAARIGLPNALKANTSAAARITNRFPSDAPRNLPPDQNTGETLFKAAVVSNLWLNKPSRAGTLTAQDVHSAVPPAVTTFASPAADRRACLNVVPLAGDELALWYGAAAGATTDVFVDIVGYFIL
jgi:hypothetical protein